MSDAGTNFVSKEDPKFCRQQSSDQWTTTSTYKVHEHCEEIFSTNNDLYLVLLQILSTSIGPGILISAASRFNRPITGLIPKQSRPLTLSDHNDISLHYIDRKVIKC